MLASSLAPPPSETLFVTGLPMDCTNEFCNEIFSQYGTVKTTTVLPVSPGKTKAAAFVIMTNVEDAQWIVDHVNGNVPQNLTAPVSVVFATPRDKMASPMGKGMMMKGSMMKGASPMAMKGAMGGMGATGAAMGGGYGGYESSGAGMGGGYGGYDSSGAGMKGGCGGYDSSGAGMKGGYGGSWGGSYGGYGGKDYGSSKGFGKSLPQDVKKYKTIMCRFFETTGNCQRGESCSYAHGLHELNSAGTGTAAAAAMAAIGKGTFTPGSTFVPPSKGGAKGAAATPTVGAGMTPKAAATVTTTFATNGFVAASEPSVSSSLPNGLASSLPPGFSAGFSPAL
ncbi:zfp36l2-B [Symbiodinium sp. CCMP2592]|nr:zfp36l2-B [Symbiodinium sp. CCMP2592]